MVRTRFAPSPTGYMHIGNLRSALFEYALTKKYNGTFILRIEDTDQKRYVEGATEFIYNTLDMCGIKIDESPKLGGNYGPYTQSERLDIYKKYANKLLEQGQAYICFCNEERLENLREEATLNKVAFMYDGHCLKYTKEEVEEKIKNGEPYVIRQKMPKEGFTTYEDLLYGTLKFENKLLEDQILIKSDGYPTYNFANVVDDICMEITHVARGCEYLTSTPKYSLLYSYFGKKEPIYIHLPHITKEGGKKISKRDGDANFMDLLSDGYLSEAIVNYLCLLGYSPIDNIEIFDMNHLISTFDEKRINTSPSVYDVKKLNWINAQYIKKMSDDEIINLCLPFIKKAYNVENHDSEWINKLIILHKDHISFGKEIVEAVSMFFEKNPTMNDEATEFLNSDESCYNTIKVFKNEIEKITEWNTENIKNSVNNTKEIANVKGKYLFMTIRIASTYSMHGPELADTIFLTEKETILERLNKLV